ncbi:MAG: MBL fold metallo-hydrolase [Anaerolineales bacterium]|nr:MBL fold metallo-hydrolase [Anaerolineales bacterium]
MSQLELRTVQVGPWGMNTYAFVCPDTNQSVLFDPGDDPDKLMKMLDDSTPVAIWLTHTHIDHVGALDEMRKRLGVPLIAHPGPHAQDMEDLQADQWVNDGDVVLLGKHRVKVYHTPGHIGDQICFAPENGRDYVVGDTIFEGGPGRTWSAEGFQQTLNTLRHVVLNWSDDVVCHPGHGPSFRLGDIRPQVEAFLAKDHGDFYGDATWDM